MTKRIFLAAVAALALVCGRSDGETHGAKGQATSLAVFTPRDIKWAEAPPLLPRGAKVAVLEGDPGKAGPFVMRLRMPDGYRIPPHTHPKPERVTVLAGTFHLGMVGTFDKSKGRAMPAGSFGTWPAGMQHYVRAEGETVIQLHGIGPWSLTYVRPEDDPRKAGATPGAARTGTQEALGWLEGQWYLVSTADERPTDAGSEAAKMLVGEGGQARFLFGPYVGSSGVFTPAPPAGKLRGVDLKMSDGRTFRGVVAVEGDEAVFCFAQAGAARPAAPRPRGTQWQERWLAVALSVMALALYLQHMLFHAVPLLWRLHLVHHADLDCDATTGVPFHPLEILLSLGIKMGADPPAVGPGFTGARVCGGAPVTLP